MFKCVLVLAISPLFAISPYIFFVWLWSLYFIKILVLFHLLTFLLKIN